MDKETTKTIMQIRASDARSVVLPFALSHIVILAILGFNGDGLGDSGVQFAMTAFLVLGSLWTFMWMDDAIQDMFACMKDLGPEFADTEVGKRAAKFPIVIFRAVNFAIVAVLAAAQIVAIY